MRTSLTTRVDGGKLPILFIVRGQPGGTIDEQEVPLYPAGHLYAVQEKVRMDERVWRIYVLNCSRNHIDGSSMIMLDNFDSHVCDAGEHLVVEEACCAVAAIQPTLRSCVSP